MKSRWVVLITSLVSISVYTLIMGGAEGFMITGGFFGRIVAQVVTVFTDLDDVFSSYVDQGGKVVAVNADETGLEAVDVDVPGGIPRIDSGTGYLNGGLLPYPRGFNTVPPVCERDQDWGFDRDQTGKYRLAVCVNGVGENPLTEPFVSTLTQVCINGTDCRTVADGADGTLNIVAGTNVTLGIDQTGDVIEVTASAANTTNQIFGTTTTTDVDNSTTETTVITGTVPGNTLGSSGQVKINMFGMAFNNSGGSVTFTYRLKYGSATHTCRSLSVGSSASQIGVLIEAYVQSVGSNAQRLTCSVLHGAGENRQSVPESFTITESSNQTLSLTVQLGTADANSEFHFYFGKALLVR